MKKPASLFVPFAATALLAGSMLLCSGCEFKISTGGDASQDGQSSQDAESDEWPLSSGVEGVASNGDVVMVQLSANMTTGYSWSCKIPAGANIELAGEGYGVSIGTEMGASGDQRYELRATGPNDAVTVTFTYARPWEDATQVERTMVLTVTSDKDGKVTKAELAEQQEDKA